eukprot:4237717-Prymnesium_polylepis.1
MRSIRPTLKNEEQWGAAQHEAERPRVAFRERSAAATGRSSPVLGVHTSYRATPFPAPFATRAGAPSTTLLCCAGG